MVNSSAEGLIGKLGMTREELKNASKTFTKEELAKLLNYDLGSFWGRFKFTLTVNRIYHVNNAEQLVFMHPDPETTEIYIPQLENYAEMKDRKPIRPKPRISYKQ